MAILFGWIVVGSLIGLAVMQSTFVWIYCRFLRSSIPFTNDQSDTYSPRVAIILCLRGADPSLTQCLTGIFSQNYKDKTGAPNYQIHFVVDDKHDPALEVVQNFVEKNNSSQIEIRTHVLNPSDVQGSLKCTALVTAIYELEDSKSSAIDVIALVDADARVDAGWLADLVGPLAYSAVGATTGNRWFAPNDNGLGSLVRQTWNAAAVAQMSFYQIPWGGSLALRVSTIHQCDLLERWSQAFCEDTLLLGALKKEDLTVVRVPNLILSSDESIGLKDATRWISRQLLTVRLYHRDWPLVLCHGLFVGFCLIGAITSSLWLLAQSQWMMASFVAGSLILMQTINLWLLRKVTFENEQHIRKRIPHAKLKSAGVVNTFLGAIATQLVQPLAALNAAMRKNVSWRGVAYEIGPKKTIKLTRYVAYRDVETQSESGNSID
ncbi:MAG: glycosyltransferase family 2 protein [Mariniblastus sp.]